MKRIITLLLALVLICTTFASCGKDSGIYYDYDMTKYVAEGKYSNVIDKETTDYDYAVEAFYEKTFGENLTTKLTEGKVEKGDVANIDYKGMLNGEAFEGGTDTGYDLEIGSGQFIDGFEEGLIGAEIGQTTNLNLKFPNEYHSKDLAGKDVVFEVKVNYVTKKGQYYEEACKQNNMTMNDLAEANQMTEDELYDYLNEYEVQNEMDFYMVAYYVLDANDAQLTKEEIETKRSELSKQYDEPLEDIGYYEINIQQAAAYDKALEILSKQAEIKK